MISGKSTLALIDELNQGDETESLEAKLGSDVGKSILETICAMSNEPSMGGGTIILGVSKDEMSLFPLFSVEGINNPDKVSADIASQCASQFNVSIRPEISREIIGRKVVIRIDVPESPASQKPIYFKHRGLPQGAFRRIGSTDQRCNDDDLQAFFQVRTYEPPDRAVVDGATFEDIDLEAIQSYRKARSALNPLAEELNWSDDELLTALNCITSKDGEVYITRAGLVSFAKPAALRRLDPSNRVDYIRVPGKSWVNEPDPIFESIEIRGPTLRIVGRIISTILDDIPRALRIVDGNAQRTDIPLIPERVVREAVVNALAHRSYLTNQPVQILRYSNRIEIRNPGFSLKSEERFDEPGSSLRNPYIAEILHETRFAETKGSGIRIMRQKMRESGLAEPTFISSRDDDKFTVVLLLHHFLSEDDWIWLAQFKEFDLSNEQLRGLIYLREMGAIDNACYRNLNQVDTLAASSALRRMKEAGLITSRGSGSRTYYEPGPQFFAIDRRSSLETASGDGRSTTMHGSVPTMHGAGGKVLPARLAAQIGRLGQRVEPSATEALLVEICAWNPCSAEELANWLGKTRNYITARFLVQLVRQGRLRYTIPDMVKHPNQRYAAGKGKNDVMSETL